MTETPDGPHTPQDPQTPQHPHIPPQAGRHPYAGPEWRRPEAAGAPGPYGFPAGPHAGSPASAPGATAPIGGPDFARPGTAAGAAHPGVPAGAVGTAGSGSPVGSAGPGGHIPWSAPVATKERPARAGSARRLVAVAALTAVLGGVAGGGTVALLDRDDTSPVASAGLTRGSGSAPAAATTSTAEAAAATALKSVVTLNVTGSQGSGTGSGVIIRADGYILTNQHVVAVAQSGGSITATLSDGRTVPATIVGTDTVTDLAVVKVSASGLTAATFADSDAVKIGQTVVAVGSPLGLDGTVTEGIVSALHRPTTRRLGQHRDHRRAADRRGDQPRQLRRRAGRPGRSCGRHQPVDRDRQLRRRLPGQSGSSGNIGIGFAIPSNTAARVAEQLITSGKATHAFLGVQAGTDGYERRRPATGATVASVEAGGPARGGRAQGRRRRHQDRRPGDRQLRRAGGRGPVVRAGRQGHADRPPGRRGADPHRDARLGRPAVGTLPREEWWGGRVRPTTPSISDYSQATPSRPGPARTVAGLPRYSGRDPAARASQQSQVRLEPTGWYGPGRRSPGPPGR